MTDLHESPVRLMKFNPVHNLVVSTDMSGSIEIWDPETHEMPEMDTDGRLKFELMSETDYYDLAINETCAVALTFSQNGKYLAIYGKDSVIRVFDFCRGKIVRRFDESIQRLTELQESAEKDE